MWVLSGEFPIYHPTNPFQSSSGPIKTVPSSPETLYLFAQKLLAIYCRFNKQMTENIAFRGHFPYEFIGQVHLNGHLLNRLPRLISTTICCAPLSLPHLWRAFNSSTHLSISDSKSHKENDSDAHLRTSLVSYSHHYEPHPNSSPLTNNSLSLHFLQPLLRVGVTLFDGEKHFGQIITETPKLSKIPYLSAIIFIKTKSFWYLTRISRQQEKLNSEGGKYTWVFTWHGGKFWVIAFSLY